MIGGTQDTASIAPHLAETFLANMGHRFRGPRAHKQASRRRLDVALKWKRARVAESAGGRERTRCAFLASALVIDRPRWPSMGVVGKFERAAKKMEGESVLASRPSCTTALLGLEREAELSRPLGEAR